MGRALQPGEKPKWFMFTMIATMVLGGLGALSGIWAPVNLLLTKNSAFTGFPGMGGGGVPPEMVEFQEKIVAASLPELTAGVGVLNLVTGVWALWTALFLLKLQPGARLRYRTAMIGLGVYEVVALVVGVIVQIRMVRVMEGLMGTIMRNSGGATPPAGFEQTFGAAMQVTMIVGLIAAVAWGGCKIFFAFWARAYVAKPDVVAYTGD